MIEQINIAALVDLYTVAVDKTLPVGDKTVDYVRQVKDPYHYKIGGVKITALFSSDAPTLANGYKRLRA